MKNIGSLLNVKNWIHSFLMKTMVKKGVKHAATTLAGLIGGIATQQGLSNYGIDIDVPHLTEGLIVAFGSLAGWILNWALAAKKEGESAELPVKE